MNFDDFDVGDIIITKYSFYPYVESNFAIHRIKAMSKTMQYSALNCIVLVDSSGAFPPGSFETIIPTDTYIKSVKVLFKKRGDEYAV